VPGTTLTNPRRRLVSNKLQDNPSEVAVLGEIIGPDILIILAVVALLFGGSQLPKLARSLGSAKHEFQKGLKEDDEHEAPKA
jgi:sec-independent protein translocase protein TatA